MNKQIISTAAILGAIAVIFGAFGAHALAAKLQPRQLEVWHTAVQYQFYHIFALLFLSTFARLKNNLIVASYWCFTLGILLFSGSLYLLACRDLLKMPGLVAIGPVTPLGGLFFIIGWITLALAAFRNK
ncbi:DUF423 domain-containing protein [Mucilaginibacter psychrotolerans]|uniref:DUF423 domain-containing protein n=1 Tax=Mucilaginibacter psychrotolerans TaxID=1524096 RepID=A0A4Y8S6Y5_9SPHI|nr:DUF423 domain-containing protein [Mucilaginibacter psychrotolerans]TFF34672.1 DUF423 domain-containing protein [Mucilaginibacter psychrotolerans]